MAASQNYEMIKNNQLKIIGLWKVRLLFSREMGKGREICSSLFMNIVNCIYMCADLHYLFNIILCSNIIEFINCGLI